MDRRLPTLSIIALLGACSTPVTNAPSLAPRAAEAIDPRLPVVDQGPTTPAEASMEVARRLNALVAQARAGDTAFEAAAARAEPLAAAAGAHGSESWIAAQQALSVAVAARGPTTRAVADIDELAARTIAASGGIPAGDLRAIEAAAAEVAAIAESQAERVNALQARLR